MKTNRRLIRSFVRRQGRMSDAQRRACKELWAHHGIDPTSFSEAENFLCAQPLIVEIGFGMGDSLFAMAQQNPHLNYVGIEVHRPGIGALLAKIHSAQLTNLKIMEGCALDILKGFFADHSLDGVQIFFPDPWPKKKHHKRRLVNAAMLDLLANKMRIGGFVHCATDWPAYADIMLALFQQDDRWQNESAAGGFYEITSHPSTKFELKALREGRKRYDLFFRLQ